MANQTVGELNVTMNLELTKLQGQIDAANKRISTMAKKAHGDVASMARNMNAVLSTIGIGVSVAGVIAFGKSVLDLGGHITDIAAEAGIGTDAFQTLSLTAMDSGVSMEDIAKASSKLRVAIQGATEGNVQFADAFSKLGLNANALKLLAPERQFEIIGQRIANATDKSAAFAAGVEILGAKGAPKLMAFLKELGVEGFDKLSDGLKGVRLDSNQLATLDAAGDKLERMWMYLKYMGAKGLVETVDSVGGGMAAALKKQDDRNRASVASGKAEFVDPVFASQKRTEGWKWSNGMDFAAGAQGIDGMRKSWDSLVPSVASATKAEQLYSQAATEALNAPKTLAQRKADFDQYSKSAIDTTKIAKSVGDAMSKQDEDVRKLTESYRQLIDPTESFKQQISEVESLLSAGKLSAEQAASAIGALKLAMAEAQSQAVDSSLKSFFDDIDKRSKAMQELTGTEKLWAEETMRIAGQSADSMTTAWVDAINGVEGAFGNLGNVVKREVEAMVAKMLFVVPTMHAIGALMGAMGMGTGVGSIAGAFIGYGGGHASGGPVASGTTYLVGEQGPELFTPSGSGNITPNNRLASIGGGGGSGIVIHQTNNFASGLQRSELLPILQAQEKHTLASIRDLQRRGKA